MLKLSKDFFFSLSTLEAISDKLRCGGLEQGQESNWCRVGGGRALYSTHGSQPSHPSHPDQGRGTRVRGFRGPAFTSVPGLSCGCSLEKCSPNFMTDVGAWEHAVSGLTICFAIMWCLRNLCTPDWGGMSPITSLRATGTRQIWRGHRCIYGINGQKIHR